MGNLKSDFAIEVCWMLVWLRVKPCSILLLKQGWNSWQPFFMLEWRGKQYEVIIPKHSKENFHLFLSLTITYLWQIPGFLSLASAWPCRLWINYSGCILQVAMAKTLGEFCTLISIFLGSVSDHRLLSGITVSFFILIW